MEMAAAPMSSLTATSLVGHDHPLGIPAEAVADGDLRFGDPMEAFVPPQSVRRAFLPGKRDQWL